MQKVGKYFHYFQFYFCVIVTALTNLWRHVKAPRQDCEQVNFVFEHVYRELVQVTILASDWFLWPQYWPLIGSTSILISDWLS